MSAAMAVAATVPALPTVDLAAAVVTASAVARQRIPTACLDGFAGEKSGLPS
jgi:hypothetical protein